MGKEKFIILIVGQGPSDACLPNRPFDFAEITHPLQVMEESISSGRF